MAKFKKLALLCTALMMTASAAAIASCGESDRPDSSSQQQSSASSSVEESSEDVVSSEDGSSEDEPESSEDSSSEDVVSSEDSSSEDEPESSEDSSSEDEPESSEDSSSEDEPESSDEPVSSEDEPESSDEPVSSEEEPESSEDSSSEEPDVPPVVEGYYVNILNEVPGSLALSGNFADDFGTITFNAPSAGTYAIYAVSDLTDYYESEVQFGPVGATDTMNEYFTRYTFTVDAAGEVTVATYGCSWESEPSTLNFYYFVYKLNSATIEGETGVVEGLAANVRNEIKFNAPAAGTYLITSNKECNWYGSLTSLQDAEDTSVGTAYSITVEQAGEVSIYVEYVDFNEEEFNFSYEIVAIPTPNLVLGENTVTLYNDVTMNVTFTAENAGSYVFTINAGDLYVVFTGEIWSETAIQAAEAGQKISLPVLYSVWDGDATVDVTITVEELVEADPSALQLGANIFTASAEGTTITFTAAEEGWYKISEDNGELYEAGDEYGYYTKEVYLTAGQSVSYVVKYAGIVTVTVESFVPPIVLNVGETTINVAGAGCNIQIADPVADGTYTLAWDNANVLVYINGAPFTSGSEFAYVWWNYNIYAETANGVDAAEVVFTMTAVGGSNPDDPTVPETPSFILGENAIVVENIWDGVIMSYTSVEGGNFVLKAADGETNGWVDTMTYNPNFGGFMRDYLAIADAAFVSYAFTLEAGETITFWVSALDENADTINLVIEEKITVQEYQIGALELHVNSSVGGAKDQNDALYLQKIGGENLPVMDWDIAFTYVSGTGFMVNDAAATLYEIKSTDAGLYLKFDALNAGDTVMIGGTYKCDKHAAIYVIEESKFVWTGSAWEKYIEYTTYNVGNVIIAVDSSATAVYFAKTGENGNFDVPTGWDEKFTFVADSGIGVTINGTQISMNDIKVPGTMYVGLGMTAEEGDVLAIGGTFYNKAFAVKYVIEESKFVWNGSIWEKYIEYTTYEVGKVAIATGSGASAVYFAPANGEKLEIVDGSWAEKLTFVADSGIGITLNGAQLAMDDIKIPNDIYVGLGATAVEGDVLAIGGTFYNANLAVKYVIEESKFVWTGSTWEKYIEYTTYNVGNVIIAVDSSATAVYFAKTGENGNFDVPTGWDEIFTFVADSGIGVTINGTQISMTDIKVPGAMYIGLGTTAKKGDVLTIGGTFYNEAFAVKYVIEESKFEFNGEAWEAYIPYYTVAEANDAADNTQVRIANATVCTVSAWNTTYNNMNVTLIDASGETLYVYGLATQVALGDIISIKGTMDTYNDERQIGKGATAVITGHDTSYDYVEMTITDALASPDDTNVSVTGTVISIGYAWSASNKNMSVTIADGSGDTLYIYKLATQVALNDIITVKGCMDTYNGRQIAAGATAEIIGTHTCSEYTEATCKDYAKCVVCGVAKDDVRADHNYVNGVCTVCGASSNMVSKTVSVSIADYASANSWVNDKKYPTITMNEDITVTATGSSNTGKYYSSDTTWRTYQTESPSIVVKAAEGKTIVSVTITYLVSKGGVLTHNGANITSKQAVTVNGNSITFGVSNTGSETKGQVRITAIEVVYAAPAPAPAEPEADPVTINLDVANNLTIGEGTYLTGSVVLNGEYTFAWTNSDNATVTIKVDGVAIDNGHKANYENKTVEIIIESSDNTVDVNVSLTVTKTPEVVVPDEEWTKNY